MSDSERPTEAALPPRVPRVAGEGPRSRDASFATTFVHAAAGLHLAALVGAAAYAAIPASDAWEAIQEGGVGMYVLIVLAPLTLAAIWWSGVRATRRADWPGWVPLTLAPIPALVGLGATAYELLQALQHPVAPKYRLVAISGACGFALHNCQIGMAATALAASLAGTVLLARALRAKPRWLAGAPLWGIAGAALALTVPVVAAMRAPTTAIPLYALALLPVALLHGALAGAACQAGRGRGVLAATLAQLSAIACASMLTRVTAALEAFFFFNYASLDETLMMTGLSTHWQSHAAAGDMAPFLLLPILAATLAACARARPRIGGVGALALALAPLGCAGTCELMIRRAALLIVAEVEADPVPDDVSLVTRVGVSRTTVQLDDALVIAPNELRYAGRSLGPWPESDEACHAVVAALPPTIHLVPHQSVPYVVLSCLSRAVQHVHATGMIGWMMRLEAPPDFQLGPPFDRMFPMAEWADVRLAPPMGGPHVHIDSDETVHFWTRTSRDQFRGSPDAARRWIDDRRAERLVSLTAAPDVAARMVLPIAGDLRTVGPALTGDGPTPGQRLWIWEEAYRTAVAERRPPILVSLRIR